MKVLAARIDKGTDIADISAGQKLLEPTQVETPYEAWLVTWTADNTTLEDTLLQRLDDIALSADQCTPEISPASYVKQSSVVEYRAAGPYVLSGYVSITLVFYPDADDPRSEWGDE